jgi:putative phosphoribosyl transferase
MREEADDVVVLAAPWSFRAVGQWYRDFEQLTDADVISWLDRARIGRGPQPVTAAGDRSR